MRYFLIVFLLLVVMGCSDVPTEASGDVEQEYWFDLAITKCGYSDEETSPCVKLTSKKFWVDRVKISNLLEENGADVIAVNAGRVLFYVPSNTTEEDFIKVISPKLQKVAEGL